MKAALIVGLGALAGFIFLSGKANAGERPGSVGSTGVSPAKLGAAPSGGLKIGGSAGVTRGGQVVGYSDGGPGGTVSPTGQATGTVSFGAGAGSNIAQATAAGAAKGGPVGAVIGAVFGLINNMTFATTGATSIAAADTSLENDASVASLAGIQSSAPASDTSLSNDSSFMSLEAAPVAVSQTDAGMVGTAGLGDVGSVSVSDGVAAGPGGESVSAGDGE